MPVRMSAELAGLFPEGVVVAELAGHGDLATLLPAEAACLGRAHLKRAREFAAGRECARHALSAWGIHDFALRVAADRQPLWPDGVVGSITHTEGFCAAAVAPRAHFASLGIDTERASAVEEPLWATICVAAERGWLESLPGAERARAATLLFSAKESLYKCIYSMRRARLHFHELTIRPEEWGASAGGWVLGGEALPAGTSFAAPIRGRYRFHDGYVSTGVAVRNVQ